MKAGCLARGCTSRDLDVYQTPTGAETYCQRHARMMIWAEYVKAKKNREEGH